MPSAIETTNGVHDGETEHQNGLHKIGLLGYSNGTTKDLSSAEIAGEVERYPDSGITVLIVGCGPGGLMSALECWRKGCTVQLIDRAYAPVNTGDVFCLQPSCMSVYRHWPRMSKEIEEEQYDAGISYWHNTGDRIYGPGPPEFNDAEALEGRKGPRVGFMQGRIKFFNMLLRQVKRCGIPVTWGRRVVEYYEDEAVGLGGVVLESGEKLEADVVIAADGIKTNSGKLIAGYTPEPKDSGQSIYRAGYSPDFTRDDREVLERWPTKQGDVPEWQFWLGAGLHLSAMVSNDMIVWGLTHKDEYAPDGTESWNASVEPEEVVGLMERVAPGWHPAVSALLKTTPRGSLVHWKLRWRDLLQEWTSPGGRIVQVGDSAHSFLPASGNGATQALEDAISLASCLHVAGRNNVAIATKVHNRLRYERVSCAQKMSFVNTQQHHFTDWNAIAENPKLIRTRFPSWVWKHDPEEYAYKKYGEGFLHVISNGKSPLQNTNYPPGHTHKPWTVEQVRMDLLNNVNIGAGLDGDWS
ncbi:hypothetical protein G647_08907 [Cladophialophora carrionii CBS 160.54]|uniref:FAD-binding domain-containing protein n=1 Tax=Cladophialophora carrionii CBS 160.54 TaxID=1279043 RepID=V9D1Q2_9EURO|nr:uncharacterized protein G647_08907 [Cladophialophora carrionii CBS 160.54]ETI19892.1 hypothetical protein G647_08907 [Cladophialophora carrionii CBS 160.54]